METTTGKDIPAKLAPYVYGVSVLIGLIYGELTTNAHATKSVLHKETLFEAWMSSPYSSLATGLIGLVWASLWLFFRFGKLRRVEVALLCFFLGASAAILTVSLTLLTR